MDTTHTTNGTERNMDGTGVNTRIALDMVKGEILGAARREGTDTYGNGPSLARICDLLGRDDEFVTLAFFSLCMTGEYPGSRSTKGRFA